MFSRHYHSELSFLREMGRAFSEAHPNTAGMLGEQGGDPDVERLLEGFAFLTARIRERLDDEVPELIHSLCELLLPHYLRPIPSCSIVEFSPQLSALRGRQLVGAGAELASVPVEGTSCRFRTTQSVALLPLAVQEVALDGPQSSNPVLKVSFQTTKAGLEHVFGPHPLRFFLHGEFAVASTLWLWFQRHCREVIVRGLSGRIPALRLGPEAIRPAGFDRSEPLLPWPRIAPEGYRLLQEYFTLPSKFLFVDVGPLESVRGCAEERFEIAFRFDRPPELPGRIGPDNVKLHCTPVINLFSGTTEPLRGKPPGAEHLLRPAGIPPGHAEVYSVDALQGVRLGRTERTHYAPFFSFEHVERPDARRPFFRLRHELSPNGDGLDAYLSIGTARDQPPLLEEEVLSVDVTCTNRALAARVRAGEICVATPSAPSLARFKNIMAASKPVLPPLGSDLHWRLVGHLAMGHRSLQDAKALRGLLNLYDFQGATDPQAARSSRNRIDAIQEVESHLSCRLVKGAALRGIRTLVDLQEAAFASRGEAFLFGCILNELLASKVAINSFSELCLRLQPSRTEYTWTPRNGNQDLL